MADINLLLRRRQLLNANSPKYEFEDITFSNGSYSHITTSNGNHFKFNGTKRGYAIYWQFDFAKAGNTDFTEELFQLPVGSVTIKLTNLNVTSNKAGYFNFAVYSPTERDGSTRIVAFYNADGTSVTYTTAGLANDERTMTAQISQEDVVLNFGFYIYNSSSSNQTYTVEFDFEMYVNGERYI